MRRRWKGRRRIRRIQQQKGATMHRLVKIHTLHLPNLNLHVSFARETTIIEIVPASGGLQCCSNNTTTPMTPFFTLINLAVHKKLGSDDVVCTSTSSCHGCHLISWHKSARSLSQLLWALRRRFLTDGWKLTQRRPIYLWKETRKMKGNSNPRKP